MRSRRVDLRARLRLALTATVAGALCLAPAWAHNGPATDRKSTRQVIVSDYCNPLYHVSGLQEGGEGFLSVRLVPRTGAHEIYRLHQGEQVSVCQTSPDGRWYGIIFKPRELASYDDECVLMESPSGAKERYDLQSLPGPCLTGWVSARNLESAAG